MSESLIVVPTRNPGEFYVPTLGRSYQLNQTQHHQWAFRWSTDSNRYEPQNPYFLPAGSDAVITHVALLGLEEKLDFDANLRLVVNRRVVCEFVMEYLRRLSGPITRDEWDDFLIEFRQKRAGVMFEAPYRPRAFGFELKVPLGITYSDDLRFEVYGGIPLSTFDRSGVLLNGLQFGNL